MSNDTTESEPRTATDEFADPERPARASASRGATLVEHALLLAFIVLVCVAAVGLVGQSAQQPFSEIGSGIAN